MIGLNSTIGFHKNGSRIHIKEKNRGKFTASAKAAGLSVQEHAKSVLNDPKATPLQKKRANFARNASKWKHEDGAKIHKPNKNMLIKKHLGGGTTDEFPIAARDNTRVLKPIDITPIERTDENGRLWSDMSTEERAKLNIRLGRNPYTSKPIARGNLNNIYPEFDIFTGIRSLYTMPKGFLKGTGRMTTRLDRYYRLINKADKGIEHAKSTGVITTKDTKIPEVKVRGISLRKKTFDVPFFSKNNLWYGKNPGYDIIVGKDVPGIEWMPITKRGVFRPSVKDIEEAYVRTTPLVHGKPNIAPASQFEYYRYYPIIGYRNVTNGFPHLPITGLSPLFNDANRKLNNE